jgi:hypothetical protein
MTENNELSTAQNTNTDWQTIDGKANIPVKPHFGHFKINTEPRIFRDGGKPRIYPEIQKFIDDCKMYFVESDKNKTPYTWASLAEYLGITSRFLDELSKRKHYDKILAISKQKCLAFLERQLIIGKANSAGVIFTLKQPEYGWKDKSEVDNKIIGNFSLATLLEEARKPIPYARDNDAKQLE